MKILFASGSPLAGVCELMGRLVNELYPGQHEARVLNNGPGRHAWYLRPGPGRPRTYKLGDPAQVREALEWSESVACQANVGARNLNAVDLLRKKHWSFIWHGCEQNGCLARSFAPEDYKHVRFLHIGQGWVERQADFFSKFDLRRVPNLISIDDPIHRPISWAERLNRLAFAPSNTKPGAPNDKGVAETERALAGLKSERVIERQVESERVLERESEIQSKRVLEREGESAFKLLLRLPFEACMREKQRSTLGLDEVATDMYHRSGLEFLSQGVPCICRTGEAAARALREATGSNSVPFLQADFRTLRARVQALLALPVDVQGAAGAAARAWVERYYQPRALLERHYLPAYGAG
jgi:hypothetical protein